MPHALHDLRHGWRALRRRPAFALLVVLTLGLAISVNSARGGRLPRGVPAEPAVGFPPPGGGGALRDRHQPGRHCRRYAAQLRAIGETAREFFRGETEDRGRIARLRQAILQAGPPGDGDAEH